MAILSGIPVLNCQSIEDTLKFYQQLLHFVIVKKRDLDGSLVWVHLMNGDTTLMLQAIEQKKMDVPVRQQFNISLYYFVNDINELHHFLKAKSINVPELKTTGYNMSEFSLCDPEGNTVTIGMAEQR